MQFAPSNASDIEMTILFIGFHKRTSLRHKKIVRKRTNRKAILLTGGIRLQLPFAFHDRTKLFNCEHHLNSKPAL